MDWIDEFISLTDGLHSPPIFRRWAGISAIAGVLQRRVWTELQTGICYTNLYVMLTGGPGTGKSLAIIEVRKLWRNIRGLFIGPDNPSKSALVKRLANSVRVYKNGLDTSMTFSSLAVPCEEFGVLITKYDIEFLSMLSHIWNNPDSYDAPRTSVESFLLEKPNLTIIAGVTPDTLGETFPEIAWGQGFTARLIFIYSEKLKYSARDTFKKRPNVETSALARPLADMFQLGGEAIWTPKAMDGMMTWLESGAPPVPAHSRLRFYVDRRKEIVTKLAMISAVSAGRNLTVDIEDFNRALAWLVEAEQVMPDVFRAIGQKSDHETIDELHFHLRRLYTRYEVAKREPIDDEILWDHLSQRIPAQSIPRIIETAERGGWIRRDMRGGRLRWIPRALDKSSKKETDADRIQ